MTSSGAQSDGRMLALIGAWAQAPSALLLLYAVGQSSIAQLAANPGGFSSLDVLFVAVENAPILVISLFIAAIGLVPVFVALESYRYRAPWFWWFLVPYSGVLIAGFPFTTIPGVIMMVTCIRKRREFFKNPTGSSDD